MREKRQREFADLFINQKGSSILYLCPRFGKCRVGVMILQSMKNPKVLIAYPDNKIKNSWLEEFDKMGYTNPNITFSTHLSMKKYEKEKYDIVILDEIHLLSENQIQVVQGMLGNRILGLTGTMNSYTEVELKKSLGLKVLARYSIKQAIDEGIITDYEIFVKVVKLDNTVQMQYKNNLRTEKKQFEAISKVIEKLEIEGKNTFFLRLSRMRIIQNSIAKKEATKQLLKQFSTERVLVFCGVTSIADSLGCPVYHSKSKEKQIFEDFSNGTGNHLAVVKIGNTGVTYKPLNKVIINYFDSNSENLAQKINRCMAMEYNNMNKKAQIYIVTTDEPTELKWLKKALEFFDNGKVKWI